MENSFKDDDPLQSEESNQEWGGAAEQTLDPTVLFIEQMGIHAQGDGAPRIAGRIIGYFIVHGGPVCFSQLAQELQVSRASISTNARTLTDLGMIEKVARPGDRQDYYQLANNPYLRMIETYLLRMRAMQDLLQKADKSIPADMHGTHARLAQMRHFFETAVQSNERLLKELEQ